MTYECHCLPQKGYTDAVAASLTSAGVPSRRTSLDGGGAGIVAVDHSATASVYGDARVELVWHPCHGWTLDWSGGSLSGCGTVPLKLGPLPAPEQVEAAVQPLMADVPVLDFTSPAPRGSYGILQEAESAYPCPHAR